MWSSPPPPPPFPPGRTSGMQPLEVEAPVVEAESSLASMFLCGTRADSTSFCGDESVPTPHFHQQRQSQPMLGAGGVALDLSALPMGSMPIGIPKPAKSHTSQSATASAATVAGTAGATAAPVEVTDVYAVQHTHSVRVDKATGQMLGLPEEWRQAMSNFKQFGVSLGVLESKSLDAYPSGSCWFAGGHGLMIHVCGVCTVCVPK
jgi:hypothetical protein